MALKSSTPSKKPAEKPAVAVTSAGALKTLVTDYKDEHFVYIQPKHRIISTGSLILDSLVKIRSGGIVRLAGKSAELGKSSEGFVLLDNYMKTMPKAKSIYFKAEARLTPEIMKRSGLKWVFKPEDWVEGTVFVYPVNVFEVMAETLEMLLPQMHELGEHLGVMIDSLDGLMLRSDKVKRLWDAGEGAENVKVAGVPKLMKELFRRLGLPIVHYDVLMVLTTQHTAAIQISQYAPKEHRQVQGSGGNSVAHQADYVFEYQARTLGDLILEKPKEKPDWRTNKTLGVHATIEIKKSGTDVTGTRVEIPIRKGRIGCAIWVEREIVDLLLGWEKLYKERDEKTGKPKDTSWLVFDPTLVAEIKAATGAELPAKVNGENQAYRALEDQPKAVAWLFKHFTDLNAGGESEAAA